jgi:transposase
MAYIGVDLHSNSFTVCYLEAAGQESFKTFRLTRAGLDAFRETLSPDDEAAVEATGNSSFFRAQVAGHVRRIVVVAPGQFQVIRKSVSKTDRNDARALAFFLSKDMLPEARVKAKAHEQLASLAHTRDKLVKLRTALINKVHGILGRHGLKAAKAKLTTVRGLKAVDAQAFDAMEAVEIEVIRAQVFHLNEAMARLDQEIERAASAMAGYDGLVSIKGIGPRAAGVFLSAIGDIDDFEDEGKLAAYFGIVPRVSQSNETDRRGRITKRGNKLARTTLVQCTLVAIRYSPYLRRFYDRIKARRGSGKAIIATARKLLGIIFQTLKNGWVFEDFPNGVIAATACDSGQST